MIAAWKHPYFNIGKEESGKNGVLIRNMLSIGAIVIYMFVAIHVGRHIHTNGFLYITLGYLFGVLLGNLFARCVLNRKYKDVVYEKYSVKKAQESRELEETQITEEAEYAECCDECDINEEKTVTFEKIRAFPQPPDHSKDRPWY
ncbi:MAG: hypothetical protein U0M15_06770 [Bacillota bacterium]|nr:hypothetical protein [Bacillota bacterium]